MNARNKTSTLFALTMLVLTACSEPALEPEFRQAPVERQDITVNVEAAGVIEPAVTVEVKSKASGEVLSIHAETGDIVKAGTLLVQIDKRTPSNLLNQTEAELEAAMARRSIAKAQSTRSKTLWDSRTINEVDYEKTVLEYANAKADVVRAEVAIENARIQLDDTDVRAPITGTIIERLVETGQVISSPTTDVGGGTLLLKMADLSSVQVRALVDETDIGKIKPGQATIVIVTAYPNQPFEGRVLKIEPQAMADQTVTTFSVLIMLENKNGLLRPGMNTEVEIRVASRTDVLAIPTLALKTKREIPTVAGFMGIEESLLREQIGAGDGQSRRRPDRKQASLNPPRRFAAEPQKRAGSRSKRGRRQSGDSYLFAGTYWVLVMQDGRPAARNVSTGLTDLEYSEVISGLELSETVLLLPSSGLIQSNAMRRERMKRWTSLPGAKKKK